MELYMKISIDSPSPCFLSVIIHCNRAGAPFHIRDNLNIYCLVFLKTHEKPLDFYYPSPVFG